MAWVVVFFTRALRIQRYLRLLHFGTLQVVKLQNQWVDWCEKSTWAPFMPGLSNGKRDIGDRGSSEINKGNETQARHVLFAILAAAVALTLSSSLHFPSVASCPRRFAGAREATVVHPPRHSTGSARREIGSIGRGLGGSTLASRLRLRGDGNRFPVSPTSRFVFLNFVFPLRSTNHMYLCNDPTCLASSVSGKQTTSVSTQMRTLSKSPMSHGHILKQTEVDVRHSLQRWEMVLKDVCNQSITYQEVAHYFFFFGRVHARRIPHGAHDEMVQLHRGVFVQLGLSRPEIRQSQPNTGSEVKYTYTPRPPGFNVSRIAHINKTGATPII